MNLAPLWELVSYADAEILTTYLNTGLQIENSQLAWNVTREFSHCNTKETPTGNSQVDVVNVPIFFGALVYVINRQYLKLEA